MQPGRVSRPSSLAVPLCPAPSEAELKAAQDCPEFNENLCNCANVAGQDGTGDKWEGVTQLQLKMCLYAAGPVYHDKCHREINSLCTFGNYNYHFGVIYFLYNTDKGSLFIILKVHLKLL